MQAFIFVVFEVLYYEICCLKYARKYQLWDSPVRCLARLILAI